MRSVAKSVFFYVFQTGVWVLLLVVGTLAVVFSAYRDLETRKLKAVDQVREEKQAVVHQVTLLRGACDSYRHKITLMVLADPSLQTYQLFQRLSKSDQDAVLEELKCYPGWHGWDTMPPAID